MRAAAGRRALEAVLLVGAVFVLGMLCGERAQAADGVPGETSSLSLSADTVEAVVPPPVNGVPTARLSGEAQRAATSVALTAPATPTAPATLTAPAIPTAPADSRKRGAADPARPPTGALAGSVDERAVRPVGELVGAVTGRPAESPGRPPLLPELPELPVLPEPPGLPDLTRPAPLPGLPEAPTVPGHGLPAPLTPAPEPRASAPRPESSTTSTPSTPPTPPSAGPSGPPVPPVPAGRAGTTVPVAFVPEAADAGGATRGDDGHGHGTPRGAVPTDPAPAPHAPGAPADRPDGTAGNGTPRHGDTPAVTPYSHPSPRLVPGAVERAEATGTQDRYRDVPVSPA